MAERVAFVLGGGGVRGAVEVGMLAALFECGIVPDLVVGTSVGAINGAAVASDPTVSTVESLREMWERIAVDQIFSESVLGRLRNVITSRTHLHSQARLRDLVDDKLFVERIEDLPVRFECVAASIERAAEHWFSSGPLVEALLASSAVPGLFPPVEIDGEHFFDGGLVHSIPVGRAVALGAALIYVLQVGRIERPLRPPATPWEVATVAFEIARRHRFAYDMASVPASVQVKLLPTGMPEDVVLPTLGYRKIEAVDEQIERARRATLEYLER